MIKINLFNKFTIEVDGQVYDMYEELGNQLSEVLSVIVYYHKGGMSKQKLIDFFWEDSENPENALKYSIFRLREKLSRIEGIKEYKWIVTKKNGYSLNSNIDYIYDIDEFNKIIANEKYSLKNVEKLSELYNGGFMLDNNRLYTYNIRMFYEDLFVNYLKRATDYYIERERYDCVLDIVENAFVVLPLNEDLIYVYLRTLIETKRYNAALKYYQKLSKEFSETYNRNLGDKVDSLFNAYMNRDDNDIDDIDDVVRLLALPEKTSGPMYVKFLNFKQFYELSYRKSVRTKKRLAVVLVKLQAEKNIEKKMEKLKEVIDSNLRGSDIYTKLNSSEYLFLFVVKDDFDIFTIMSKLQALFYLKCKRSEVKFHFYHRSAEQIQSLNNY